jgi:hypothetical protein
MKKLLIALLFPLTVTAQSESNALKLESAGIFNYKAVVKATNKQSCIANVEFEHNGQTIIKPILPFSSDTIQVTLPNCIIKARPLIDCDGSADMGYVEVNMCVALPIKFEWIMAKNISNYTVVKFKVGSIEGKKEITLNFTTKNNVAKKHPIRFPSYIIPGDVWEVTVNNIDNSYTLKKLQ